LRRILFYTHRNPQGYRIQQYFPFLEARGFTVELATTKESFLSVLQRTGSSDVVYVQRILLSPFKSSFLRASARRLVYDFDDAVMYGIKGMNPARERRFQRMVRNADIVFCGNYFLLQEARKHRENNIYYVPTVVDTNRYMVKTHEQRAPCVVGWVGSTSTLPYLSGILTLFSSGDLGADAILKVVADHPPEIRGKHIVYQRWTRDREMARLLSFDVGIMPSEDTTWSRGKCGLKLIQYMATGLPSLAHPFGVAQDMVADGVNGFLRNDDAGWIEAITRLAGDPSLRRNMGKAARETVEERYSLSSWGPKVAEVIDGL